MVLIVSPSDRVVVVTAGAHGLGLEWVDQYSRDRDTIVIAIVDVIRFDLTKLVRKRKNISIIIDFDPLDFSSFKVVGEDIAKIAGGRVDLLINCASPPPDAARRSPRQNGRLEESTVDEWRKNYDLHVLSPVFFTLALLPLLRCGNEKKVVNVDSTVPVDGGVEHGSVFSARAGLWAATEQLHYDYREEGFTFITTNPSYIDNEGTDGIEDNASPSTLEGSVFQQRHWVDQVKPEQSGGHYSNDRSGQPL